MKTWNLVYLFILGFLLYGVRANAQTSTQPFWFSVEIGHNEYKGDFGNEFYHFNLSEGFTFGGAVSTYLNSSFDLAISLKTGVLDAQENYLDHKNYFKNRFINSELLVRYKLANGYFFEENSRIRPYIASGIGLTSFTGGENDSYVNGTYYDMRDGSVITVPAGIGLDIPLSDNISLYAQTMYQRTFAEGFDYRQDGDKANHDDYMIHSVGIKFALGGSSDKDHDGVPDEADGCPRVKGPAALFGCPDTDEDGTADNEDRCPQVSGVEYLQGCPDSDGDRVEDSLDECPAIAGSPALKGCPDDDGDNVINKLDECPDRPGMTSTGCPDRDGDKIDDRHDECPDVAGLESLKGCPDSDGDGISDAIDKCPDQAGVEEQQGCPVEVPKEITEEIQTIAENIEFDAGKSEITDKFRVYLLRLYEILQQDSNLKLLISAYTDSEGAASYNWQLSKERANAIKQFLIKKGISKNRLKANGYGEISPIATNDTPEGRAKNRRIELELTYF